MRKRFVSVCYYVRKKCIYDLNLYAAAAGIFIKSFDYYISINKTYVNTNILVHFKGDQVMMKFMDS